MTKGKQNILIAFKKAKSLTEKVVRMTEDGEYCIDIMQQNLAVIGLLKSAHQQLMANHLNSCFKNAMASKNEAVKQRMVEEILRVNRLAGIKF
ncbi:MAG: metal-sensing transcriptional repressor [Patescibacteria group bacterium]